MPVLTEHRLEIAGRVVVLLEGPAGWGECSPLPGYPCDPVLARRCAEEAATQGFPSARRTVVEVNALVTGPGFDPRELAGFPAVKVKVGGADVERDVDLVAAVRDAVGRGVGLRVDANGAWDLDTATSTLERLARYDVELAEQPVASLEDLGTLRRRVGVPVAADECVHCVEDAVRLRMLDAADAIVLKVQRLGGVRVALEIAAEAGVPGIPSSMHETSVGLAAGLALAAALPEVSYACGLATAALLHGDVTHEPLLPVNGRLQVRVVVPAPDLLARYAAAST